MKFFLSGFLFLCTITAFAGGKDAILGDNDSFACDAFSRDAVVACIPGVRSNYRGRVSFPRVSPVYLGAYQVHTCSQIFEDHDVICGNNQGPGPGPGPGPIPPRPVETRRVELEPAYRCLDRLPNVDHADKLVSDAFFPKSALVDTCENDRDREPVRRVEYRGFTCAVDTAATGQSDRSCVDRLLQKVNNPATIKGGHRRRLADVYCAGKVYTCTRQQ
jgi:hypothetical protein